MTNEPCWIVWETGNTETYRCFNVETAEAAAFQYLDTYAAHGECEVSVTEKNVLGTRRFKLTKTVTPLE